MSDFPVRTNRDSSLQGNRDSTPKIPSFLPGINRFTTNPPIQTSGNLELYGQLANQPMPLTEFPTSYSGVQGFTQLQAFGLPFRADVNWMFGPEAREFGWNQLTFSLDPFALKDSLRSQILAQAKQNPAQWEATWQQLRDEKQQELLNQYSLPATPFGDSLLSAQIARGELVGRMQRMLSHSSLGSAQAEWQKKLDAAGLVNEQQIGQYLDSLRNFDPSAYEAWLKEYSRVGQAEALRDKVAEYQADSTWLPDWQDWQKKKEEVERWAEASPEDLLQDEKTLKKVAKASQHLEDDPSLMDSTELVREVLKNQKKSWQWMSSIERFQVGSVFPQKRSLSFQGSQLRGVDIAVAPGNWYVSTTLGQLQPDAFSFGGLTPRRANGKLGRFTTGWGTTSGNHLHLSWQMVQEQADSLHVLPRNNQTLEANGRWNLLQGAIQLDGSGAVSRIAFQKSPALDTLGVPLQEQGTAWSLSANGTLFDGNSRWLIRHEQIGSDYVSLGAPWLLRNRQLSEARWDQSFLKGRATLTAFYRQDRFPPLSTPSKAAGQELRAGGIQGAWKVNPQTRLTGSWSPYYQGFAGFDSSIVARQSRFQGGVTHSFDGDRVRGIFVGQYILGIAPKTDSLGFTLHQLMLTNQLGWKNGSSLSLQLSGMYLQFTDRRQISATSFVQSSFYILQRWRQEVGGGYTLLSDNKGQAYFSTRTLIPITDRIQATATFRADHFRNQPEIAQESWMYLGRVGVMLSW